MDCPLCKVTLQMADRQGVEIDYCPKCRGIWLDRGELEKLIELSGLKAAYASSASSHRDRRIRDEDESYQEDDPSAERRKESEYRSRIPRKRESWLSDLFDFG